MSETSTETVLAESVREVLEKMFFVDIVDPAPGEAPAAGLAAELSFEGEPPGVLRLVLDEPAARSAAGDFLGEDPAQLGEQQLNDVVCELANMICGSVLSRIESSATFRLSKPAIVRNPAPVSAPLKASFQATVGGGVVRADIWVERPVCPGTDEFAS